MKCNPTNVPPADEVDISEVWEKYRIERDRRIRKDGQKQYFDSDEDFTHTYEGDPHTPQVGS